MLTNNWATDEWRNRAGLFLGQYLDSTEGRALLTTDAEIRSGLFVLLDEKVFRDKAEIRREALLDYGLIIPDEYFPR